MFKVGGERNDRFCVSNRGKRPFIFKKSGLMGACRRTAARQLSIEKGIQRTFLSVVERELFASSFAGNPFKLTVGLTADQGEVADVNERMDGYLCGSPRRSID